MTLRISIPSFRNRASLPDTIDSTTKEETLLALCRILPKPLRGVMLIRCPLLVNSVLLGPVPSVLAPPPVFFVCPELFEVLTINGFSITEILCPCVE